MNSFVRNVVKMTSKSQNADRASLKNVWTIKVFGCKNEDVVQTSDTPKQAGSIRASDSSEEMDLFLSCQETVPKSTDNSQAAALDENIQRKKWSAKGLRRNTTVDPEAEKLLTVKADESVYSAVVARVTNEEHSPVQELIKVKSAKTFVPFGTSKKISKEDCTVRRIISDFSRATRTAKRVRFLVNGDRFCKVVVEAVSHNRYRSFDRLLDELTKKLSGNKYLPCGVRMLFSTDGRKISQLEDFEDGKFYICSSNNNFIKKLDYDALNNVKPSRPSTTLQSTNNVLSSRRKQLHLNIRPKMIFVVRNGPRPRKVVRILLNKRNSPSLEHVLTLITEAIQLNTGAVRKIYMSSGRQLMRLEQFFERDNLFYAYGSERIFRDGMHLNMKEIKAMPRYKNRLTKSANELETDTRVTDASDRRVPKSPITSYMPSEILNKYTIGDELGRGHFSVVYRCLDKRCNIEYALKVIEKTKSTFFTEMIENEVSTLKTVNEHPNIIRLISEQLIPTHMLLITELISGGDLSDALERETDFSQSDFRLITTQLASALAYIHAMDIMHRDVKPANILIVFDSDGHFSQLKLADFGLSKKINEAQYKICGTPYYMAPEMLNREGYGVKIDVWSAGVILYELLSKCLPFNDGEFDEDNVELYEEIRSGAYDFPAPEWDNVPEEAKNLVRSMLQCNPSERLSAEDVLGHPWLDDHVYE